MIRWNKEEILRALETDVGKEAKAQLRDIVEEYFSEPKKWMHKADQEQGVDEGAIEEYWKEINYCFVGANSETECKDSVKKKLRQLLTQKRTVTLCEVHEFCHNLLNEFDLDREDLIGIENELTKWLESKGAMVGK